jgi:hypothetical protein
MILTANSMISNSKKADFIIEKSCGFLEGGTEFLNNI